MKDKLLELIAKIRERWDKATKKARVLFLVSLVAAVALVVLLVMWVTYVNYVAIDSGLSPQESANVLSLLGEMGVEPKVSTTGAIMVPEKDANRVRMQLATKMNNNFGYEIYQGLGLTATQSDKNQAQLYQLQNRLQGVIETFDEVSQAVVTLSVPQPSIYALQGDQLPPTASVKIIKRAGRSLTPEQVQGIINLVKNSVSGLKEENIAISDESGDLKASAMLAGGTSVSKLNLTEQVNSAVRSRILSVLYPVFGSDNIQVAVNSILDTDQKTTQTTTYLPFDEQNPQNNPLDYAEYDRNKYGGEAGPATGVPGANDNVDVPQYSAENLNLDDAGSYSAHDVYDYLVNSVRDEIVKEGYDIDLTVAVVINSDNLPQERKDQVIDLVTGATGVTSDKIKVQSMRFVDQRGDIILDRSEELRRIILITGIALLALTTIFIIVFMAYRKKQKERGHALAADGTDLSLVDLLGEEIEYEPIQLVETQEQKLKAQIRDLATSDPEIVAQLIKTWLVNS